MDATLATRRTTLVALIASLLLVTLGSVAAALLPAQEEGGEDERPPDVTALAWMAGHWRMETARGVTEELWMPPRGGLLLGLNRSVRGKGRAQFEYLRIEQDEKGIVYQASPGGRKPTPFRLVEVDEHHAVFANPEHDFPKRIEYRLVDGRLTASAAGDRPGPSWTFERVAELD